VKRRENQLFQFVQIDQRDVFEMTWWEVEDMAVYISDIAEAMDDWSMSNAQMRAEEHTIDRVAKKINQTLSKTSEPAKKQFLIHLANRVEELREHLTERLKRDIPR